MTTAKFIAAQLGDDHAKAVAYWADKEHKKFAVHIVIGSGRRPNSEHITYIRARTSQGAISAAKRERTQPGLAQYLARLAGPAELGCVPIKATA